MVTLLAVLLTGAMWFASSGVNHVWPLAWIAPLPLLLILPDLPAGRAALAAWAASSVGALNLVLAYSHAPPVVLGMAVLLISLPFALLSSVWRLVAQRGPPPIAAVAYPALVASTEYLVSCVSPHGSFGSLAYSQAELPAVLQVAPITGPWGISFLVSLVPSAIAVAWRGRRSPSAVRIGLGLATIPLALTLALGTLRLAATPWHSFVRIGLVTSDSALDAFAFAATDSGRALPVVRLYANRVAELAGRQAEVVVLPEKFVGVTPAYGELARGILGKVAREHGLTVVAGFNQLDSASHRNLAVVLGPDGGVALEYAKMHLIPGIEDEYIPGSSLGLIPSGHAIGVAICKDLDFTPLGRAYGRAGVGLLLVPAWDFGKDGWIHSRMAVLRGVEGGYTVARAASRGRLTVSDPYGRILAERTSDSGPEVLLAAVAPIGPGDTFYSRTGDWFAWLCLLFSLACGARVRNRA